MKLGTTGIKRTILGTIRIARRLLGSAFLGTGSEAPSSFSGALTYGGETLTYDGFQLTYTS